MYNCLCRLLAARPYASHMYIEETQSNLCACCLMLEPGSNPCKQSRRLCNRGFGDGSLKLATLISRCMGMCYVRSTDTQCSTPTRVVDESFLMNSSSRSRDSSHGGSTLGSTPMQRLAANFNPAACSSTAGIGPLQSASSY